MDVGGSSIMNMMGGIVHRERNGRKIFVGRREMSFFLTSYWQSSCIGANGTAVYFPAFLSGYIFAHSDSGAMCNWSM